MILDKSDGGLGAATGRDETLQIELLSGWTGARIWSGGHLPESSLRKANQSVWRVEVCVVDPKGSRDVLVAQAGRFGSLAPRRCAFGLGWPRALGNRAA